MAGTPLNVQPQQQQQPQRFDKKVGIVGLGRMGSNIAKRLFHAHVPIGVVYDKNVSLAQQLSRELRCYHAQTLAEVNANGEIIFTVVSDDEAVNTIFAETGDSLLLGAGGTTFIECSTVSPKLHVEVANRVAGRNGRFIEACMAGSAPQAHDGTLYLIMGGNKFVVDQLAPLLRMMSRTQVYVGEIPRAAEIKALVNMVMNINTAGLAEGLALGSSLGINLDELREIFARTGAASRVLLSDGEDMQKREHTTYFAAEHARKDSGIALELAHEAKLALPLAEATKAQYDAMCDVGLGHIDKSGISELTFAERRKRYIPNAPEKVPATVPK
ncbi:MAG: NAD(P)-dependent oxidoreductase [Candidatus Eremiobacteraeota bacterium]|nr:NAD(P)-dependent oxidoreductase [Candidatus Eremiobacteraeota bacterium]MBV8582573.1 NAD(P)-dependent oxidoreductase [Candidatus Eremiobacteraeota bacterium]